MEVLTPSDSDGVESAEANASGQRPGARELRSAEESARKGIDFADSDLTSKVSVNL